MANSGKGQGMEDATVQAWINHQKGNDWDFDSEFEPEAHYNHYGDRGVVDLYEKQFYSDGERYRDHLFEMKGNSALEEATGANEVLRQFNRMRRYFYMDESRHLPPEYTMELCFVISEKTVNHVAENFDLYLASRNKKLGPETTERGLEIITLRLPNSEKIIPVHVPRNTEALEVDDIHGWKEWLEGLADDSSAKVVSILTELGY